MKTPSYDIIVVGGGPVGSYTACLLAGKGFRVGIFEKDPEIGRNVNCTGIISTECFRQYGLPEHTVTRPVSSVKAFAPSGDFLKYQAASPFAYVVRRDLFDRAIHKRAEAAGAVTHLDSRVTEIVVTRNAFTIKTDNKDEEQSFSSEVGIIATGFARDGLPGIPEGPGDFLYGAQTEVSMEDVEDVEVCFGEKIAPGSFSWIVPTGDRQAKVGLLTRNKPASFLKTFIKSRHLSGRVLRWESPIRCSPIPTRTIPKSYADRLVVVGEAAGQVKATTGGGIYFGLLCSEIAADTIADAFRQGDFTGKVLKAYDRAWRGRLAPELKAGQRLKTIYSMLTDRQIDFLMDIARKDGIMPVIEQSGFDWHKDVITYLIRHLIPKNFFRK